LARARGQFQKKDDGAPVSKQEPEKKEEKKDLRELEKRTSIFEWE
jgi:hypothetical protein